MRAALVLALALALLLAAAPAHSRTTNATLNHVSSVFAMRSVSVRCYDREEKGSPWSLGAWGYVKKPLAKASKSHLDNEVCAGALGVNDATLPAWQRAIGVMVLVHESYHLRRWGGAGDEAKTECQAVRHWKVAARMLGATEQSVAELWPAALAAHYELANFRAWFTGERPYYDPNCEVPPLVPYED